MLPETEKVALLIPLPLREETVSFGLVRYHAAHGDLCRLYRSGYDQYSIPDLQPRWRTGSFTSSGVRADLSTSGVSESAKWTDRTSR